MPASVYSQELVEQIVESLQEGNSIRKTCNIVGIALKTYYNWMGNQEFYSKCARAREIGADRDLERLEEITEKVITGEIDAQRANVVSSNLKWFAMKKAPKQYGEKLDLSHSGGIESKRELTEADRALIDLAIDHKINGGKNGKTIS